MSSTPLVLADASADATSSAAPLVGRLSATPKGFAFVALPDGGNDVFIPPNAVLGALHGEQVEVSIDKVAHDGRRTGRVTRVLDGPVPALIGRVLRTDKGPTLVPLDARYPTVFLDGPASSSDPLHPGAWPDGAYMQARLTRRAQGSKPACAQVVGAWGTALNAATASGMAAAARGFGAGFSAQAEAEAAVFGPRVTPADTAGRRDLTALPWVTIDGASTRDFDDALAAQKSPDGSWKLWVAIADVAHYVRPGTALDAEARARGTSVYLPGVVLPMLPEALSNGLCSLNPGADRLAVVAELDIDTLGRRTGATFHTAVIRSHARLTYGAVSAWLESGGVLQGIHPRADALAVAGSVHTLSRVHIALEQERQRRGALEFASVEPVLCLNSQGAVSTIHEPARTRAHRLVEETMIAANVAAAERVRDHAQVAPYRNHPTPCPRRYAAIRHHAAAVGCDLPEASAVRPRDLANLVTAQPHLEPFVRNAQLRAAYSPSLEGHFGLGLATYTHFTSPIRRYPDLLVHRALMATLAPGMAGPPEFADAAGLAALAEHLTEREGAATAAEREATDRLRLAWLAQQPEGQARAGTVNSATAQGLFVTLAGCGGSGLLPPPAGAVFDPGALAWRGPDRTVTLGDPVTVAIGSCDPATLRMGLTWAEPSPRPVPNTARPGLG